MNQASITLLTIAAFVLLVDQITVWLRRRVRRTLASPEPSPIDEESEGAPDEGVAIECE